jgi:hypothetical protein
LWPAAVLLYGAGLLAAGLVRLDSLGEEAWISLGVSRQLLEGLTEGRQALVSSVWWPPFSFLIRLPFCWMSGSIGIPVESLVVAALGAACVPLLAERALLRWGVGPVRYAFAALCAAQPGMIGHALNGSSVPVAVATALLTLFGLVQWIRTRGTGPLVYVAAGSCALAGLGVETALWAGVCIVLLLADLCVRPAARKQRSAVFVLALLPVAYTIGLWVLMNWLIMGDPLHFLRSVTAGSRSGAAMALDRLQPEHMALLAVLGVGLLFGVIRRDRGTAALVTAGAAFVAVTLFVASHGFLFGAPLGLAATPLVALLTMGYLAGPGLTRVRSVAFVLILCGGALVTAQWRGSQATQAGLVSVAQAADADLARRIERHVLGQSPYAKVFACGYDSFRFAAGPGGEVIKPMLDFNMARIRRDYHGHKLYLLVHRPVGRSAMDTIHWRFDRPYYLGVGETLYDSDWGDWRLFEVIEAPLLRPSSRPPALDGFPEERFDPVRAPSTRSGAP